MSDTKEQMITITVKEYEELLKRDKFLMCLEGAGVDNWDGFDYAEKLTQIITLGMSGANLAGRLDVEHVDG